MVIVLKLMLQMFVVMNCVDITVNCDDGVGMVVVHLW